MLITSVDSIAICSSTSSNYVITSQLTGAAFTWQALANAFVTGETTAAQTTSTIPDILVNTAGMTNVEECELNPNEAFKINSMVPGMLAKMSKNLDHWVILFLC
jgi:dTDP-4-dehydrorhamnose reductase